MVILEFYDNSYTYREKFKNYEDAAKFIKLIELNETPLKDIIRMIRFSALSGCSFHKKWYALLLKVKTSN